MAGRRQRTRRRTDIYIHSQNLARYVHVWLWDVRRIGSHRRQTRLIGSIVDVRMPHNSYRVTNHKRKYPQIMTKCQRRNAVIFAPFPQARVQRLPPSAMKSGLENLDDSLHAVFKSTLLRPGTTTNNIEQKVRFSNVGVNFYSPILGDNPSAMRGPPLAIGWEPYSSTNVTVDHFESHRPEILRHHLQLVIPADERHRRLEDAGYTSKQIMAAVRETNKARAQRKKTVQDVFREKEEEMIDNVRHSTSSFMRRPWKKLRNINEEAELDALWTTANAGNMKRSKSSKKQSSWRRKVAKAA